MRSIVIPAALTLACLSAQAISQDFDPMQFADSDGDGKVSQPEYAAFIEQAWGYFSQGADSVKIADLDPMAKALFDGIKSDENGVITHKAYTDSGPSRFKAADKNGDGTLSKEELTAAMSPPAA